MLQDNAIDRTPNLGVAFWTLVLKGTWIIIPNRDAYIINNSSNSSGKVQGKQISYSWKSMEL